jgi:hypothetical protein
MDVSCALASKILGNETEITDPNSFITFTHMKPHAQHWLHVPEQWTKVIGKYYKPDGTLILGNYAQQGLLHYVEDEFLTDDIIRKLK